MDGYKIYAEVEANRREKAGEKKPAFKSILKEHAKKLGTFVYESIRDGNVPILSGLFKFGEGIGLIATGNFKEGFGKWAEILPAMLGPWGKPGSPLRDAIDTFTDIGGETINDAVQGGKRMAGDAWGWMSEIFSDIGAVFVGFFDGIKKWVSDTIQKGKDLIWDMIPDALKPDVEHLPDDTQRKAAWNAQQQMRQDERDRSMSKEEQRAEAIMHMTPRELKYFKKTGIIADGKITDEMLGETAKINDGRIYKDGKVTSYNSQDDILAAKSGGPIDKMLDGNSAVMKSLASINAQQLNVLVEIREGIKSLGKSDSKLSFSNTSLTQEFFE